MSDGKLRWACYLASGNSPGQFFDGRVMGTTSSASHPAYEGGRVYVSTDLGAIAEKMSSISDLERSLGEARANDRTTVLVIDTDPMVSTEAGGHWWDVAVPQVSERVEVQAARKQYEAAVKLQRVGD